MVLEIYIRRGIHDRHLRSRDCSWKKKKRKKKERKNKTSPRFSRASREFEPRRAGSASIILRRLRRNYLEEGRKRVRGEAESSARRGERDHVTKNHITRLPPLFKTPGPPPPPQTLAPHPARTSFTYHYPPTVHEGGCKTVALYRATEGSSYVL